ncbi:dTDP-4-dehydrorhamnose reductase family protein [Leptospira vanthielii]|uniref:dTDP-4-dehydrorhamnose reductase n=1 Tax=Leptospira vanthielii TaxID=293085 RepID=A0ABY2NSU4_9LEPT|nr:SDR family oxidoreductase [Leptospira vanthielii]TGM60695.1 SDR family oxidoreductase [Leptospira vanthielii]
MKDNLIIVVGGDGLLGSTLVPFLKNKGSRVITVSRTSKTSDYNLDFSDEESAKKFLDSFDPEFIINLAGLTDVDFCEASPNMSYRINVKVVENIANWIKTKSPKCHLVHISTDHVYDGNGLHSENDVTITNYYAFSKLAGELAAMIIPSTVLRTNFFGKSFCAKRRSISDWLYTSLKNKEKIQVFEDVFFNPLSMDTLSELIFLSMEKKPVGVFNLGSRDGLSKADFAFLFSEIIHLNPSNMTRTTTDKVSFLKIYRPKNMVMDCSKFEKTFNLVLPTLKDEIIEIARKYYETTKF